MINFTAEQIQTIMTNPENIRNTAIIGHINHGKTTISDSLITKAGIVVNKTINDIKYEEEEKEKEIAVKYPVASLNYEYYVSEKSEKVAHLINLIDPPGHVDCSAEVTAALRITDGALLVVDCVEGVCLQTESSLRQALGDKVRPALMINKTDRQFLELKAGAEEIYQSFNKIVELINNIICNSEQPDMGNLLLDPTTGNVAFGSGKEGWAFTLTTFARIYAKKFKIDMEKIREKFWGDNYYDPKSKKWSKEAVNEDGESLKRAFCSFIMEPILKLSRSILDGNIEQMNKILTSLEISLRFEDKELTGERLLRLIMSRWMNSADALLEMIVLHLPSPKTAQKYRVSYLYEGPQDDEVAASFRDCDLKGPLIVYASRLVPSNAPGRFLVFGRVFGGTVSAGQKVRIMGMRYIPGKKGDLFEKSIQRTMVMMGRAIESVPAVPCGNIVGLVGIDQSLLKTGTISDNENARCIRNMKFSVSPLVRVAVEPKNPADLPKFIEGLRKLSKSDPALNVYTEENGEHIIAGCSESHLEISLSNHQKEYMNCELKISDPLVAYKETVTATSSQVCLSKSPNKHNRLYATAEPLHSELSELIEAEKLGPKTALEERQKVLCNEFGWDKDHAKNIWAFGLENKCANVLINAIKGTQHLHEIQDSTISAFHWFTQQGVMIEENMRSVRINLIDVTMNSDAIHRGGAQIIPTARRLYYACELTAKPRLQEPRYMVEIIVPTDLTIGVYKCLNQRRGVVAEEEPIGGTALHKMLAYLPIAESFGNFYVR